MAWETEDESTMYTVVVNHEEQYSIWPADRERPPGWNDAGKTGTKSECLAHIDEVWTDMRPLSLRRAMEEAERNPPPVIDEPEAPDEIGLVERLCTGSHDVAASLRREATAGALKERIDMGYVHIKFTGTRGGTELGVRLEPDRCAIDGADFESGEGSVHLEGTLTLDYVPVRCVADINLSDLTGSGHLDRREDTEASP